MPWWLFSPNFSLLKARDSRRLISLKTDKTDCVYCRLLAVRAGHVCRLADRRRHLLYFLHHAHVCHLAGSLHGSASAADRPSSPGVDRRRLGPCLPRLDPVVQHCQSSHRCRGPPSSCPAQRRPTVLHRLRTVRHVRVPGRVLLPVGRHARDLRPDDTAATSTSCPGRETVAWRLDASYDVAETSQAVERDTYITLNGQAHFHFLATIAPDALNDRRLRPREQEHLLTGRSQEPFNPLTPILLPCGYSYIKHPTPDRIKPSFVMFDIRALWH